MNYGNDSVNDQLPVSLSDIRQAALCIQPFAHRTPILTCQSLDQVVGASVYLKCENFQKVGAFKVSRRLQCSYRTSGGGSPPWGCGAFIGQPRPGACSGGAAARHSGIYCHA